MRKLTSILLMILSSAAFGLAQQTGIPERVTVSLDALLKTRTSNQVFNMKHVASYFYVSQGAVYVNVLFTADLDEDRATLIEAAKADREKRLAEYNEFVAREKKKLEERNKKIRERNRNLPMSQREEEKTWEPPPAPESTAPRAFHNLYLRLVKDGQAVQRYKSPMPFDEEETEYYSFGLILEPGKYDLLANINRYDDSQDGTLLVELDVPRMTLAELVTPQKKIEIATPVFYKKVNTLNEVENRFTVVKNCYQVSPFKQEFYPYTGADNTFKASENPYLTFFVLGVPQPWDIAVKMEIQQGKKKVVAFKIPAMNNPYFFQPLEFKDKDNKPLPPGDYLLSLKLTDNNQKSRNGEIELPLKIIE